ncbi:hypothetical protein CS542_09045 [Pedobacter sp. IW39]|nr:hypothetical protein CS542_09045 [Pedobacter sp. IW39]
MYRWWFDLIDDYFFRQFCVGYYLLWSCWLRYLAGSSTNTRWRCGQSRSFNTIVEETLQGILCKSLCKRVLLR